MIGFEILNLEHRTDRRDLLKGNFITQEVPYENITFQKAIYGADYSDAKSVCDAAVTDGFPEFAQDCEMGGRGDAAYHWGVMRILRHVASDDYPFEFAYFNQDDRILPKEWTYDSLKILVGLLKHQSADFLFIQLGWNHMHNQNVQIDLTKLNIYHNWLVFEGVNAPGDSGLILSKAGAKYLLNCFQKKPNWFENLIFKEGNVSGCYSLWETIVSKSSIHPKWLGGTDWTDTQDRLAINTGMHDESRDTKLFTKLLNKIESDKQCIHNYGFFYESLLKALRVWNQGKPINVLEIGVVGIGKEQASEYAFRHSPDVKQYVGIDSVELTATKFSDNNHFIHADAYKPETLEKIKSYGKFHLIIDDGSHDHEDQVKFFDLYRHVRSQNSVMVCEDVLSNWSLHLLDKIRKFGLTDSYLINTRSTVPISNLIVNYQLL